MSCNRCFLWPETEGRCCGEGKFSCPNAERPSFSVEGEQSRRARSRVSRALLHVILGCMIIALAGTLFIARHRLAGYHRYEIAEARV